MTEKPNGVRVTASCKKRLPDITAASAPVVGTFASRLADNAFWRSSITSTSLPCAASAAARLTTVDVLPVPPIPPDGPPHTATTREPLRVRRRRKPSA